MVYIIIIQRDRGDKKMTQIKVFTREDVNGGYDGTLLRHLKPRSYMNGYSFKQLMKYAKEELYWEDIKEEDVVGFEIFNKYEHWTNYIEKEEESY